MKIAAYCALYYGAEWLQWAIESVTPVVDEYHVFYTPHPSHGHKTRRSLPKGEDAKTLRELAEDSGAIWHEVSQFYQEGDHRDYCVKTLAEAGNEIIVWNDADEVWDLDELCRSLDIVAKGDARDYRVHAMHFWKSVNWVCYDACMPTRFIKPSGSGEAYIPGMGFYHFGYAQSELLVQFKASIHGHRAEWRRNWWGDIYKDWKPTDVHECGVHPTNECDSETGKPFWTPVPFDRFDIEHLIGDHPYFSDELI